jgi:hypothetical protein
MPDSLLQREQNSCLAAYNGLGFFGDWAPKKWPLRGSMTLLCLALQTDNLWHVYRILGVLRLGEKSLFQSVDNPCNTVPDHDHIEIDQQAQSFISQTQVAGR